MWPFRSKLTTWLISHESDRYPTMIVAHVRNEHEAVDMYMKETAKRFGIKDPETKLWRIRYELLS